jgi:integrase/recombinase XerD
MKVEAIDWARVIELWRGSGRAVSTRRRYVYLARRYVESCKSRGRDLTSCLTHLEVQGFVDAGGESGSLVAVRALWCALRALGHELPPWRESRSRPAPAGLVLEFVEHRRRHRGVATGTTPFDARTGSLFLDFIRERGRTVARIRITDVDDFVASYSRKWARTTVAGLCSTLRAFLSFLHQTGRVRTDLGPLVVTPHIRRSHRPPRALAWTDVRRILRAIDVSEVLGRRDFAMFLMMATYGMGAGEIRSLRLEDIDWSARSVRVRRPKTGTETLLPLLDPVARALGRYLRDRRPAHTESREVFVSHHMPHAKLSGSSAIRHRLARYATLAGVKAEFLGTHVFRHTHATRQIEGGATAKIVGDILGHRRPESTSAYVRSALRGLRTVALQVPR